MLLGVNGKSKVLGTETVCWLINDDFGVQSNIVLQKTLYASPICLLSPQHRAQCAYDHFPTKEGTWCTIYSNKVVLHWSQKITGQNNPYQPKDQHTHLLLIKWSNPCKIINGSHGIHVRITQNRTHSSIQLMVDT